MARLLLVGWRAVAVEAEAARLRAAGHEVRTETADGARAVRKATGDPPDALVVYLTHRPSHGRETAAGLRGHRAGRTVPVIFVGGEPEDVEKALAKVPDAQAVEREELEEALAALG
jgi:DNA-binding response OmpR family regulator